MVTTDLIRSLAKQVIRERFYHYSSEHGTDLALIIAAGYNAAKIVETETTGLVVRNALEVQEAAMLVALGLHPVQARAAGIRVKNPYHNDNHGLSDPLHLALFFAEFEHYTDAESMLAERDLLHESYAKRKAAKANKQSVPIDMFGPSFWPDYMGQRLTHSSVILPSDLWKKRGLPLVHFNLDLDNMYLEACFDAESFKLNAVDRLGSDQHRRLFLISNANDKRWVDDLRGRAFSNLSRLLFGTKNRAVYSALIQDFQMCKLEDALAMSERLTGAREALLISRADLSSKDFVRGLRALAGLAEGERKKVVPHMARPPTLEEVKQVRSKYLIEILNEMPWELLEPLTKVGPLRQIALPHAETTDFDLLNSFLVNHDKRPRRIHDIIDELRASKSVHLTDKTTLGDWRKVMTKMHSMYVRSSTLRRALVAPTNNDPYIAFLAVLRAYKADSPAIREALSTHPNHEAMFNLVTDFQTPSVYEATN